MPRNGVLGCARLRRGLRRSEALLGMLSLRPMSGYEIRQAIEGSIGNFWRESYGQIYPTLKRAGRRRAWPRRRLSGEEAGRRGPCAGRTRYALTAEGRKRLRSVAEDALDRAGSAQRDAAEDLLCGAGVTGGWLGGRWRPLRSGTVRELERFAGIRRWLKKERAGHPDRPYWEMTLEFGRAESEAYVRWSERMLGRLDAMKDGVKEADDAR